ncbi:MAG: PrsW family intramembrane metalloprotease [Clostridia bacterium]|nr:PrsW family intramembrane metalloprotease [Clostridia bacterium]
MTFLAILPCVVLFIIVWRSDKIEKEPPQLLLKLLIGGALTIISAMIIGLIGTAILNALVVEGSLLYLIIDNFIVTALVEEGGKYFVLKRLTWRSPAFDYTFDAVVYAVTVSLGFAVVENILYLSGATVGLAFMRGILSVPGHAMDGVFMGYFYGIAKRCEYRGDFRSMKLNLKLALIVPMLLHGFYDFCLSTGSDVFIAIFFIFEIIVTVVTIIKFRKLSKQDAPFISKEETFFESEDQRMKRF